MLRLRTETPNSLFQPLACDNDPDRNPIYTIDDVTRVSGQMDLGFQISQLRLLSNMEAYL
jgi:hypothetical protein